MQLNEQIPSHSEDISFNDFVLFLWKYKLFIITITIIFTTAAVIFAIKSKEIFSTSTVFITKSSNSKSSGLSNFASLAGIQLVNNSTIINPSNYLHIVIKDKEFVNKILNKKWLFNNDSLYLDQILELNKDTLINNWKYVYKKQIMDYFRESGMLKLSKDNKNGILTLIVNMPAPTLAYDINIYVIELLNDYICNSLLSQAREKRMFIENRIKDVEVKLQRYEDALTHFKERNIASISPKVMLKEMRLTRQVTLNQEVFIQLQKQYELAKIEELNNQTHIHIIQNPEIPYLKTSTKKIKIVLLGFILGLIGSTCIISLFKWYFDNFI